MAALVQADGCVPLWQQQSIRRVRLGVPLQPAALPHLELSFRKICSACGLMFGCTVSGVRNNKAYFWSVLGEERSWNGQGTSCYMSDRETAEIARSSLLSNGSVAVLAFSSH